MMKETETKTLVVTTGGTIEAQYNPEDGTPHYVPVAVTANETCIPAALKKMGLDGQADVYPLAMKDSKEVTTAMLDHILWKAASDGYDCIVIVHGTDTMPLHARYLKRRVAEYGAAYGVDQKCFILTGAMGPLRDKEGAWREPTEHLKFNDGWHNLRQSLKHVNAQAAGVYVTMGDVPKEADTIDKKVEVDMPGSRTAQVVHSGFVADDPARHIETPFG
jgi:L-asparaginase/Glu-tRNA(Gln) amidotransferase subunit D